MTYLFHLYFHEIKKGTLHIILFLYFPIILGNNDYLNNIINMKNTFMSHS